MIHIISRLIEAGQEDLAEEIYSVSYPANLGFQEMVEFWRKASPKELALMEKIINRDDETAFRKLIKRVLNVIIQ